MRVLITGADGFVGGHLTQYLATAKPAGEMEILGLGLAPSLADSLQGLCSYCCCDVRDGQAVGAEVTRFAPDYVFHLAAQSSVARSWEDSTLTYEIALHGQDNLMRALVAVKQEGKADPTVMVACSAEEYGAVKPEELPIVEDHHLNAMNPYAFSKVIQDYLALMYFQAYGLKTVRTRAFNQTGPGQSPAFVVSDFAKQVAEIEAGLREPVMRVGNLEARRDFSDVRDLVSAYWLAAERGEAGQVYNVCSGQTYSIKEILDMILSSSSAPVRVEIDPARLRPMDIPELRGDNTRLCEATGWQPAIPMERTVRDVLDWWRGKVG